MRRLVDRNQLQPSANKLKPVVVMSIEDDTGLFCIDILELQGQGFGFREFRRDPEDPFGWRPTGLEHSCILDSSGLALDRARQCIDWLEKITFNN